MKKEQKDGNVVYFYKERPHGNELIAIDNGESRMAMREWNEKYLIALKNMATGEELEFTMEAQELCGKAPLSEIEVQEACRYRQYAIQTISHIFWERTTPEPLENKIAQLEGICQNIGISMVEITHCAPDFQKTTVYHQGKVPVNKILQRDFAVGKHKQHVPIHILQ